MEASNASSNLLLSFMLLWIALLVSIAPSMAAAVFVNDNTRPAGRLEENVLNLKLYAGVAFGVLKGRKVRL